MQENPVQSLDITTGVAPSGWGNVCVSVEPGALVGKTNVPLGDDVVILSDTSIGSASSMSVRASQILIGTTEHTVNTLRLTRRLGSRDVVYSTITPSLPNAAKWEDVVIKFADGTQQPLGGAIQQRILTKDNIKTLIEQVEPDLNVNQSKALIAYETKPTDLSAIPNDAIIRVITPPAWYRLNFLTSYPNTPNTQAVL